jgi:hypothetical protein
LSYLERWTPRELKQALAAMTFGRIRKELLLTRMTTPPGERRERLEQMIHLNKETTDATRKRVSQRVKSRLGQVPTDVNTKQLFVLPAKENSLRHVLCHFGIVVRS